MAKLPRLTRLHALKRSKNYLILGLILGTMALLFALTIVRTKGL
jgi:hypothetical protein